MHHIRCGAVHERVVVSGARNFGIFEYSCMVGSIGYVGRCYALFGCQIVYFDTDSTFSFGVKVRLYLSRILFSA